jgi:branched-chain amino acid transport system substrate-binding protein
MEGKVRMKRLFLLLAVLVIAGPVFAGGGGEASSGGSASGVQPVKIAFYGSISGVNSESGRQGMLAVKAAQQYVNENGGIKALGGAPIEIVPIDGTSDSAQGVLPLERALSAGGISGIVGSAQSAFALISLPILQKYRVPAVTASAANGTITQKGCEFIFQPAAKAAQFSPMQLDFLRFIAPKMGKTVSDLKFAIVFENSAWGEDNAKANSRDLSEAGLTIAVNENYEAGKLSDASPIVTKMKNAGVDVVFPSCYANDAKLLMTAMNAMKYKPIIIAGGSAFTWPSLLNDLGQDVNGICSADGWVWDTKPTLEFAEFTKIRERYERENGEFIPGQGGPSIISFMLIVEAIENGKSADSVSVRDELRKLNADNSAWFKAYSTGRGSFDNSGHNAGSVPVILQWQNEKPRCVYPPEAASADVMDPLTLKPFAK